MKKGRRIPALQHLLSNGENCSSINEDLGNTICLISRFCQQVPSQRRLMLWPDLSSDLRLLVQKGIEHCSKAHALEQQGLRDISDGAQEACMGCPLSKGDLGACARYVPADIS